MTYQRDFERRIAALLGAIANEMPTDIDAMSMTRLATASPRRAPAPLLGAGLWSPRAGSLALGLVVLALVAVAIVSAVFVGARPQSPLVQVEPSPGRTSPLVHAPPAEPQVPSMRIGFVGLPPADAIPSMPERGSLVLAYAGRPVGHPYTDADTALALAAVWLFADGRMIWTREEYPYGANDINSGLLEQRLTPAGLELIREEALATGLFERGGTISVAGGFMWATMTVAAGEQLVTVNVDNTWPRENPIDPARHRIRQEHANTFRRLHSILIDPVSWLPEGAWVDGQVRAFIPSRYAVCVPSQAESAIPASAREILAERGTVLDAAGPTCLAVSTDDARALVAILDVSELGKGVDDWGLAYQVPGDEGAFVVFDPVLPDGSVRARGG